MFIDGYESSNLVEDQNNFLTRMEDIKLYIVQFEESDTMETRIYLSDFAVKSDDRRLIILITNTEYTFFSSIGIGRAWNKFEDPFL